MKIGMVGPTRMDLFCRILDISFEEYEYFLEKIAETIARSGHEMVILPEQGSVQEMLSKKYKDLGGKKVIGIVPKDDVEFGIENLNEFMVDEIVNCKTWRNQPEKLCEESDILVVVGLSPGAVIEISYSKWFKALMPFHKAF